MEIPNRDVSIAATTEADVGIGADRESVTGRSLRRQFSLDSRVRLQKITTNLLWITSWKHKDLTTNYIFKTSINNQYASLSLVHLTDNWFYCMHSSVVVTAYDFESGRPGTNLECGPIFYEASITAQVLPEPSSLRGSTLGTRATEHKGCTWGMQINWWLQPRAVFSATPFWHQLAYATKMKSIQLLDSIVMASPWDSISYIISLHYTQRINCVHSRVKSLCCYRFIDLVKRRDFKKVE